jgi:diaminohydroxyphosphoribosylaminopyrimidine deaminase/5-amino-6-(5-phosphoribosylamino)uracil reductase
MDLKTAEKYMRFAIESAKKGADKTAPNPLVGCIVVKNKKIIVSGYHKQFGGPHAEIVALKKAGKRAEGATCFVTLEPCAYYGKTPPCVDMIIRSGVKELVCAAKDPNPLNNGRGLKILKQHGVKVSSGILKKEAEALNTEFFRRMRRERPLTTLKLAQSLDGKIATSKGDSKWISSPESRRFVQNLRKKHDAILIGINTLLSDDPVLTIRNSKRQPFKVIVDTQLKAPLTAKIFTSLSPGKAIIATTMRSSRIKERALRDKGAGIIRVGSISNRVDLKALMKQLLLMGIGSVLVEGGGEIAASLLEKRLIDKLYLFIAPILIGGRDAPCSIGGDGVAKISQALKFTDLKLKRIGKDLLVETDVYRDN